MRQQDSLEGYREGNMKNQRTFRMRPVRAWLACAILSIAGGGAVWAQLGTATISGSITDSTGAVVVGAGITVVNNGTGFQRQTTSNAQGAYNLPGLTPGSYNLF